MSNRRKSGSPDLSPSVYHRHVMNGITPSMRYDGGDVRAWQRRLRRKLRELLAIPRNQRRPLDLRTLWTREHPLGRVEKIVFRAEVGADVPAYVCLPKDAQPPYCFFLCMQGHNTGMHVSLAVDRDDEITPIATEGDRDFAPACMRRGIAALCIEQRGFGERREQVQQQTGRGYCDDAAAQALLLGKTLIGQRVFDVDRAIDYLLTRDDCDPKRIGAMGNSGGGTTAIYSAALLGRLALAMPSCSFAPLAESNLALHLCVCTYIPRLFEFAEMSDVLGLFAPRPLVVVAGRDDPIKPLSAVRRGFAEVKRIYRAAGAAERCHLVVGPQGHRFYADLAWSRMLREIARR